MNNMPFLNVYIIIVILLANKINLILILFKFIK